MVAVATALENIFPPTPSDVMLALAAFLTHRTSITPLSVFLVGWGANVVGAVLVYTVSRRYGRAFFEGAVGRRLLTPAALAAMEREYLRFGVAGIFVTRLLPGFRSVVAPFAGLVNLPPLRALLPMALASGLWYGVLVFLGARLGAQWDAINRLVSRLNRSLAVIAALSAIGLVVWILFARRRRRANPPLWRALHQAFLPDATPTLGAGQDPAVAGAATLLLELAHADQRIPPEDLALIEAYLRERWEMPPGESRSDRPADIGAAETAAMAERLARQYDRPARLALAARLARIAGPTGALGAHEERLMGRAADLLGVTPDELARVRTGATV